MYEHHFGLSKPPFRITPDPDFFFAGGRRGAVLEALVYAVMRGEGIVKVVGEVGSGKTMLCRMLERELPAGCEKIYLANPRLSPAEILQAIAIELGLKFDAGASRLAVMHALHEHLLARHADNVRVIMFVEEAQGTPLETLEEIRMLSNLETSENKLLQIVLFGQPELDDKLDRHEIRQLRERITHSFALMPLVESELRDYVVSRVRASGYRGPELFTGGAIAELARHSHGLLRRINILADKALLAAFAANADRVERRHVRLAARDSEFGERAGPRWSRLLLASLFAAILIGLLLSAGWEWFPRRLPAPAGTASSGPPPAMLPTVDAPAAPAGLRASDAVSPSAPVSAAPAIDNQALLPEVSPVTGLVGTAHLRPLLDGPPSMVELEQRWGGER